MQLFHIVGLTAVKHPVAIDAWVMIILFLSFMTSMCDIVISHLRCRLHVGWWLLPPNLIIYVSSLQVWTCRADGRTDGRTAEVVQSLMRHFRLGAAGVMRSFVELKRRWCRLVCLKLCPFYAVHARRTAAIRCVVIACCETHTETDRQTDTDKNVSWPARFDAVCLRCFHVSSSDKSLAEILAFVCFLELLLFKISNWFKTSQILSSNEETVANYGKCITTQSR